MFQGFAMVFFFSTECEKNLLSIISWFCQYIPRKYHDSGFPQWYIFKPQPCNSPHKVGQNFCDKNEASTGRIPSCGAPPVVVGGLNSPGLHRLKFRPLYRKSMVESFSWIMIIRKKSPNHDYHKTHKSKNTKNQNHKFSWSKNYHKSPWNTPFSLRYPFTKIPCPYHRQLFVEQSASPRKMKW